MGVRVPLVAVSEVISKEDKAEDEISENETTLSPPSKEETNETHPASTQHDVLPYYYSYPLGFLSGSYLWPTYSSIYPLSYGGCQNYLGSLVPCNTVAPYVVLPKIKPQDEQPYEEQPDEETTVSTSPTEEAITEESVETD